jgi:hypothetical protein
MADPQTETFIKAIQTLTIEANRLDKAIQDLPQATLKACLNGLREHTEGFQKLMGETLESSNITMRMREQTSTAENQEICRTLEEMRKASSQILNTAEKFETATTKTTALLDSNWLANMLKYVVAALIGGGLVVFCQWGQNKLNNLTLIKADAYDMMYRTAEVKADIEWLKDAYNKAETKRYPPKNNQ